VLFENLEGGREGGRKGGREGHGGVLVSNFDATAWYRISLSLTHSLSLSHTHTHIV
jgi:hypothetical protein